MLDLKQIKHYLKFFSDLDLSDIQDLMKIHRERHLLPGDCYIQEGSTAKRVAFIKKGLIRAYFINEKGEEISFLLRWENQFVASHDIIILNRPSRFVYEAMEACELLELDYEALQKVIAKNSKLEKYRKDFLLRMLSESLEHLESFVLLSPEERYLEFVKSKPNILNRVPNKYIASILGITPVSLSRIRKRIAAKKH